MVEEVVPRDSDKVRRTLDVKHAVVVVLVTRESIVGELAVINPDVGGLLNVDQVTALGGVAKVEVADDNVLDLAKTNRGADETWQRSISLVACTIRRPSLPALDPTPNRVVSLERRRDPQPDRVPDMRITPPFSMASSNAEQELTVTPLPVPPPVVPTPYPTSWLTLAEPQLLLGGLPVSGSSGVSSGGSSGSDGGLPPPPPSRHWEYHWLDDTHAQPIPDGQFTSYMKIIQRTRATGSWARPALPTTLLPGASLGECR